MKSFELVEPATLAEALAHLDRADRNTRAIAGGTALMLMMKSRLSQPARLVSLHRLNGALREIQITREGELSIGALTTLRALERSATVKAFAPVVTRALRTLSNIRVRNAATVGGHLAHGDPHMDLPPILLTLGARVRAASTRGERWIDLANLFVGYYETAIEKEELIIELAIPAQPAGICTAYEKCASLSADDWPAVGVAVWYRVGSGSDAIAEARIAISAATERPVRAAAAERELVGSPARTDAFARAADAAAEEVQTLADIRGSASYKREMVRVHVRRALECARRPHIGEARSGGAHSSEAE